MNPIININLYQRHKLSRYRFLEQITIQDLATSSRHTTAVIHFSYIILDI